MPQPKREPIKRQLLALPNLITYGRILAIPAVMAFMYFDSQRNAFIAAMIFAAASATDAVDGYLARRFNLISLVGKFLDPLADKLIVMGCLVMLLQLGRVNVWVVVVILAREMTVNGLRTLAASEGLIISARDLGKMKTAFQMVGIWALLVHYPYPIEPIIEEPVVFARIGTVLLYISVVYSLLSAFDYFWGFYKAVSYPQAGEPGEDDKGH